MSDHGKRYTQALEKVIINKLYPPEEAVQLVKDLAKAKFNE